VTISWRYLSTDKANTAFNIYSNGKRLNPSPLVSSTFFRYPAKDKTTKYSVVPVIDGKETKEGKADYTLFKESSKPYISIPLNRPADVQIDGRMCQYSANDASVGDVDGDGEYEIILKWDCMGHDNSHEGVTGNVLLDCYKLNGKQLWRIDLGRNIRAGAHYTQFMVFDFDGDGKAELMMKTADGTKDGKGNYIRRERSYGSFKRSFDITDVDENAISAEYKNGILIIDLPKRKPEQPVSKRLEIK
jgi:rhamnogalacturonan endolyase